MRLYSILLAICNRLKIGVTETGSDGNWRWRKYSDGTVDLWYYATVNAAFTLARGGVYATTEYNVPLPFALASTGKMMVGSCGNPSATGTYYTWLGGTEIYQNDCRYRILCGQSNTLDMHVNLYIHGTVY